MQNNDAKEQSFIRLIKEYGPTITKVCYFYAVDSDDLNDLRQEVMINLWRGFDANAASRRRRHGFIV